MTDRLLMGSGPSNVPPEVLEAMAEPTIGHLDPAFLALADQTNELLRRAFRTENRVTFPVSGTGSAGMETMLANFLEPGEKLLAGVCGAFGARIADAARRLGVEVTTVDAEWGRPVEIAAIEAALDDGFAAVAVVHGETSTGVAQPLEGLAGLAHGAGALLLVDTVTSLGGYPFAVDDLGIDVAFSGTQKCLNCPPGLAPITASERALEKLAARETPVVSWCFDVAAVLAYWGEGEEGAARAYHHTPPINSIYALEAALELVLADGLEQRWRRHGEASARLIEALEPLGCSPLVAEQHRLHALTTIVPPEGTDEAAVRSRLLEEDGIEISAGLGPLAGKVWRIGTMGANAAPEPVDRLVAALAGKLG